MSETSRRLLAKLLLSRNNRDSSEYQNPEERIKPTEVRYFAQDGNGEWYGYKVKPFYDDKVEIWKINDTGYLYLGKTKLNQRHDTTIYEVTP